jgi:hypothetical protein
VDYRRHLRRRLQQQRQQRQGVLAWVLLRVV